MKFWHLLKTWFENDLRLRELWFFFPGRCSCCFTTVAYLACSINVLSNVFVYLKRDYLQTKYSSERNHSGPLQYRQKRDTNNLPLGMCIFLVKLIGILIIFTIFFLLCQLDFYFISINALGNVSYLYFFNVFSICSWWHIGWSIFPA